MNKRLAAFAGTVRHFVRLRPFLATFAILLIHVSSTDRSIDGTIDRVIQFVMAYIAMYAAMTPNTAPQRMARPSAGATYAGGDGSATNGGAS